MGYVPPPPPLKGQVQMNPVRWNPWFAWHPVKTLSGKYIWLKKIYRRSEFWYDGPDYEYGDMFDMMKDIKSISSRPIPPTGRKIFG